MPIISKELVVDRNRDAWFVIRGFVFQVECTIQRWFNLQQNEELRLECGEDFARFSKNLVDGKWHDQAVLEQVKSRRLVTLRDGCEALANFCEHRRANLSQGINLRFCFVTNAEITRERPALPDLEKPGITVWSEVASGGLDASEKSRALSNIRAYLSRCNKPRSLNLTTWKEFVGFLKKASEQEWEDFVCSFEWHTNVSSPLRLGEEIQQALLASGEAASKEDGRAMYERLFAHIFHLLASPDSKNRRLTPDSWRQIARQDIDAKTQSSVARLAKGLEDLEQRIAHLENSSHQTNLSNMYLGYETSRAVEAVMGSHTLVVGREKELQRLDKFVGTKGNNTLLVTAGPGWGKSALLAQLVALKCTKGEKILYYFFSGKDERLRSQSNAYQQLLSQLLRIHNRPHKIMPSDVTGLRDVLCGLLAENKNATGQRLTIVLDGLDEAQDIPFPLPISDCDSVSMIVSARAERDEQPEFLQHWLHSGIQRMQLDRLPSSAVAEYLKHSKSPVLVALADDKFVCRQINEKTQGFPLYLRFLVEELCQAKPNDDISSILEKIPSGFNGYIKRAFQELASSSSLKDNRKAQRLFAVMASAYGPLSSEDLQEIVGLTVWELAALPWQVTRWLTIREVGDGEQAYNFSHPLLAREFASILKREAERARENIISYCQKWNEHHSLYSLQHLPAHLNEGHLFEELFVLAYSPDFRQAQIENVPDDPELPLRTISIAFRAALEDNRPIEIVQNLIEYSRLTNQTRNSSPLQLLRSGWTARAWNLIDLANDESRVLWNLLLVWELFEIGDKKAAKVVADRLRREKNLIKPEFCYREIGVLLLEELFKYDQDLVMKLAAQVLGDDSLEKLAIGLAHDGGIDCALMLLESIETGWQKIWSLCDFAETISKQSGLAQANKVFEKIRQIIAGVSSGIERSDYAARLCKSQAQSGLIEEAYESLKQTIYPKDYLDALETLIPLLAKQKRLEEARRLINLALPVVESLQNTWLKYYSYSKIVGMFGEILRWDEAESTLKQIADTDCFESGLSELAQARARAGMFEDAMELCNNIQDSLRKSWALQNVASAQMKLGQSEHARSAFLQSAAIAQELDDESVMADELDSVVKKLISVGCLDDALQIARTIPEVEFESYRSHSIARVAIAQVENGTYEDVVDLIRESKAGLWSQTQIASIYAKNGKLEAAKNLAMQVLRYDAKSGIRCLVDVTKSLNTRGLNKDARSTIAVILATPAVAGHERLNVIVESFVEVSRLLVRERHFEQVKSLLMQVIGFARTNNTAENIVLDFHLHQIAFLLHQIGDSDGAFQAAQTIEREYLREKTIKEIEQLSGSVTKQQEDQVDGSVGNELINRNSAIDDCTISVEDILSESHQEKDVVERINLLCSFVTQFIDKGDSNSGTILLNEAKKSVHDLADDFDRHCGVGNIIDTMLNIGWTEKAKLALGELHADEEAYNSVVDAYIAEECLYEALDLAEKIPSVSSRVKAICRVAVNFSVVENKSKAEAIFQSLLEAEQRGDFEGWYPQTVETIASAQVRSGFGHWGVNTALSITSERYKCWPNIASSFHKTGDWLSFRKMLMECVDYRHFSYKMSSLIAHFFPNHVSDLATIMMSNAEFEIWNNLDT